MQMNDVGKERKMKERRNMKEVSFVEWWRLTRACRERTVCVPDVRCTFTGYVMTEVDSE